MFKLLLVGDSGVGKTKILRSLKKYNPLQEEQ